MEGSNIFELITVGVISVGASVTAMLIISGIKQKRKGDTPDTKMVQFMTEVNTALESIAESQKSMASTQQIFNTNLALLLQSIKRMPDDIRTAVRDAIGRGNGSAGRRFYDENQNSNG